MITRIRSASSRGWKASAASACSTTSISCRRGRTRTAPSTATRSRRASPRRWPNRTTHDGDTAVKTRILQLGALFAAAMSLPAAAQGHLRIALAEDPDNLDPTTAGSYVGRIVLASLCDKLFDIDEKLNIVPQLALSHATSED